MAIYSSETRDSLSGFLFVVPVDKDERDQEARVLLLFRKMLQSLVQFIRKIQLEEGRIQMQLKEVVRQRSKSAHAEEVIRKKFRQVNSADPFTPSAVIWF